MIETFFLDWGFTFGAGVLFGIAGRRDAAREPLRSRAFALGLAYVIIGVLAIAIALYALRPDWMWMYWVDASALPLAAVALAFAVYPIAYVAGFTIVQTLEHARRNAGWILAIVTGALITIAEVSARTRLLHVGTRAQFAAGRAPLVVHQPIAWLMLGGVGLSTVSAFALAVRAARATTKTA